MAAVALLGAGAASAQEAPDPPPPDLSGLSLEELGRVEIVHAASRRDQQGSEAPSSVTVVTADQIQQAGFRTLADLLRSVAGFYVTDDRNYSYVGVRGFGRPGDYNTRILLLVDGFRLNDAIYDMAPVGYDFPIDLDLVQRVEIVRGPGAAIYGNSAFFAVINVVTKRGRDVEGELSVRGGSFGTWRTRASYGKRLASGFEFLGSATLGGSAGEELYFPEFDAPGSGGGVARGLDDERFRDLYASLSRGGLSLVVAEGSREKGIPTAAYWTLFGDPRSRTWDTRTLAAVKYEGRLREGWEGFARAHYGRYHYRGHYAFSEAEGGLELDHSLGEWWGLDVGLQSRALGRHLFVLGGELQDNLTQDQGWSMVDDPGSGFDARHRSVRGAVYAQDELRLSSSLAAHAGARLDWGPASGTRTSPRLGLVWRPGRSSLKLLYGAAFRAPNEYERHYYEATGPLVPERVRTLEAVAERYLGRDVRLSLAVFHNWIDDLIALRGEQEELEFENAGRIDSCGVEAGVDAKLRNGVHARLWYSLQRSRDEDSGAVLTNSPVHLLDLGVSGPILEERVGAGLDLQYTSARRTLAGAILPAFALANLTIRAPRVIGALDATLGVYNLFDTRYSDPASAEHMQDALPQPRRSVQAHLSWRF